MKLLIRELEERDEKAFFEGMKEWEGESLDWYSFAWKEGMAYADMLQILRNEKAGVNLAPGRVPHTMLYGFLGEKIIGRVSIRHSLNEYLLKRGGNIGYSVAPRFRKNGFASEMFQHSLKYCKNLGLNSVLITCSEENIPSWKIIERFGGNLENKFWDEEDQETIRRYWIQL